MIDEQIILEMKRANDYPVKTTLTADEKLRAAFVKRVYGTSDAEIAALYGVTNVARVNEGIKEVLGFLGLSAPGYKQEKENDRYGNAA